MFYVGCHLKSMNKYFAALSFLFFVGCGSSLEPVRPPLQVQKIILMNPQGESLKFEASHLSSENTGWFLKSPVQGVEGAAVEEIYSRGYLKNTQPILVAVLDSGVSIDHEDLKNKIWTNPREIPGNGKDDDHNGYIDDVHGWNFVGTVDSQGRPINFEFAHLEIVRVYRFLEKKEKTVGLSNSEKEEKKELYDLILSKQKFYQEKEKELVHLKIKLRNYFLKIKKNINKNFEEITEKDLLHFKSLNLDFINVRTSMYELFVKHDIGSIKDLIESIKKMKMYSEVLYSFDKDPREKVLGDDLSDFSNPFYGNSIVSGDYTQHGTHVAGIIAAERNNGIGIKGVAESVQILPVRVVPYGDEADKDVYFGIKYAVDQGARIINMSFGKHKSLFSKKVQEAIRYAKNHDVLIVHSAGNLSENTDEVSLFPNVSDEPDLKSHWIGVGANTLKNDASLVASFSNYGQTTVDLFAPGKDILSTVPHGYGVLSGTSMAAPVVSGVAALLWSQYPHLSAPEVKRLILKSLRKHDGLHVIKPSPFPNRMTTVLFSSLSDGQGVVDASRLFSTYLDW
ncbi:MAG: hypothetical protein CL678_07025 [Bdellovibrionaceae bacterium]|nr:hypothetical protein [Pseudobdellovibrionaceae bacterium]